MLPYVCNARVAPRCRNATVVVAKPVSASRRALRAVLDLFSFGNWKLETSIITQPANQRRPRCFDSRFRFRILGEIARFRHDFEIKTQMEATLVYGQVAQM
jgi:hypothetical protein